MDETIESLKAEIAYLKACLETQEVARLQLIHVLDQFRSAEFEKGGPCFP